MAEVIEYFYSTRSSFTYLGHAEIVRLAAQHGRRLVHRPVFLSVVVPGTGGIPFQDRHPARLAQAWDCLLYTSPSPRDQRGSRMPSSA